MSEIESHEPPQLDDEQTTNGPAQPGLLREINERVVLDTIRDVRAVSRAEIARRTGLSKPTVSLAIRTLESNGLVARVGMESGRPGRAGVLYAAVSDAALAIGLEIGVGAVRGHLVDLDGHVLAEHTTRIPRRRAAPTFDAATECAHALVTAAGRSGSPVAAITVGTPGVIHPTTGVLTQAGTMPELDGSHPAAELTDRTGVPVSVFNDVDLAALGEQADGLGRDIDDFVVLWVGTGLGAALMLQGRLHRGHRGGAGEVFGIPFAAARSGPGGPAADELRIDASAAGIVELAHAFATQHPTLLTAPFNASAILDAAALGDPLGVAVRDRLAQWMGWYAAPIAAVIDPELIILAGSVGSHDTLREPVTRELASLLIAPPAVASSKLSDRAVLAGATADARAQATDRTFARRDLERAE